MVNPALLILLLPPPLLTAVHSSLASFLWSLLIVQSPIVISVSKLFLDSSGSIFYNRAAPLVCQYHQLAAGLAIEKTVHICIFAILLC